jgi:hypothetical protein
MNLRRLTLLAGIFGGLAQIGARPSQPQPDRSAPAIAQVAETFFAKIRSDVANALQVRLKSREIKSQDLAGIVALLDSSKAKLQEARFGDKLNLASQQAERVQTQAQALLKDPGNKEAMAVSFDSDSYVNQLKLEKATEAVLERKIVRLRGVVEELRKYTALLEDVISPEQLTERVKIRLAQLLSEWKEEPVQNSEGPAHGVFAVLKTDPDASANPTARPGMPSPARTSTVRNTRPAQITTEHREDNDAITPRSSLSNPAKKVASMSRQKISDKLILKYINAAKEPFGITTAEQILMLQEQGVSSASLTSMLRRDSELRDKYRGQNKG